MSSILRLSNQKVRGLWSKVQQNMPRNIFNLLIKYLNNTLPTKKNLHKWSLSDSTSCSFYLNPETLQHIAIRILRMADTPGVTTLCFSLLQDHSPLCRIACYMPISHFSRLLL